MNKIFAGLLFLFLDIYIGVFSIFPAWVGYVLIYMSIMEQVYEAGWCEAFAKLRPWVIAGGVVSAVAWIPLWGVLNNLFSLAGFALQLVVTYLIPLCVEEYGNQKCIDLNASAIRTAWYVMAVGGIAAWVLLWALPLAFIAVVVRCIAAILYLVKFYQSKQILRWGG